MSVKHFREHTEHSSLIFIHRTFDINVKQNGLCLPPGSLINKHKGGQVVLKFPPEHLHSRNTVDLFVLQNVRQHF